MCPYHAQGYCPPSGGACHKFPVVIGESGSWLTNPSIAPYCPSYDYNNGVLDLNKCIANDVQVWTSQVTFVILHVPS